MRIAILGAGGHTARFVLDALAARGVDAKPLTRKEVDATDRAGVRAAIEGCDALIHLAGPFLRTGLAPLEAAIDARVPYVDTTGEQAFLILARRKLDARARDAGVPLVNAMAYEYALGDLAARAHFPEGGDALHVLYRSPRTRGSAGTKKSALRILAAPTRSYERGRLARTMPASRQRAFATSEGDRVGVLFAGGECVSVPEHTPFRTVRTYMATRRPAMARVVAPLAHAALHGPLLRAAERMVDARHAPPNNERARGEVHLVAEPSGKHVVVTTPDPYFTTGHVAVEGAIRLVGSGKRGVLAPANAFDAAPFLEALAKSVPGFGIATFSEPS